MTNKNLIIINGENYDALSGKPLNIAKPKVKSLEGIAKTKKMPDPITRPIPKNSKTTHQVARSHDIISSSSVHSKTMPKPLMRIGVKKPSLTKPIRRVHSAINSDIKFKKPNSSKIQHHDIEGRLKRSELTSRSSQVKHFSKAFSMEIKRSATSPSVISPALTNNKVIDSLTSGTTHLQDILDRGLRKASSHTQIDSLTEKVKNKRKKSRTRKFNMTVVIVALLAVLGLIAYHNIPEIDVRIASSQAGIHGEIPGYVPSGFKFDGPIKYGEGMVTVIYTSKNGSFRIIQQSSMWDSVSLKDIYVAPIDPNYKVVEASGRIIYLYSQGNATWVNGGIWYQITDSANLSTANLLNIATSL